MSVSDPYTKYIEAYRALVDATLPKLYDRIKFVFEDPNLFDKFPDVVNQYYSNAVYCFLTRNFLGSLACSSSCVEYAINDDQRMLKLRGQWKDWLNLNPDLLRKAKQLGLPIDKLLIKGDNLAEDIVWFIIRRNKFLHGVGD